MMDEFDFEGLPYSLEAEQSVLGALLLSPETISKAISIVSKDAFYSEQNRNIFEILVEFFLENRTIDFVTVLEAVVGKGVFGSADDAKL